MLEVKVSEPIPVKYGEKSFTVCRPKVGVVREFQKKMKGADSDVKVDLMIEFCLKVGVPEEIANDWDVNQLASFFGQLSSDEKKT